MGEDVQTPRARGKGGPKPGMTWAERALRDTSIVAAVCAGDPVVEVARAYGLTRRQVNRIMEAWRSRPTVLDDRPMEIVEQAIRRYEGMLRDFSAMAEDCRVRAPAVAIAAMKGYAETNERYLSLLGDIGKLPDNLELLRSETEMRRIGEMMVERLEAFAAGAESAADLLAFFDGLLAPATTLWREQDVQELGAGEG